MNKIQEGELITSSRISVVIQGLTHYVENDRKCLFYQCVNSIKKYLPDAEIIVSTWKGQLCDESILDKVIYNNEPESIQVFNNKAWNYNKMIVSTYEGIKVATREYVLKFRADLCLTGIDFFYINQKDIEKSFLNYKITKEPINISNLYVRKPTSYAHLLFHLSDIVQFGYTSDLIDIWNRHIVLKDEIIIPIDWWSGFYYPILSNERMVPEQALMVNWLNNKGFDIYLKYPAYLTFDYIKLSELLLSVNFNVINWECSDIKYPDRFIKDKDYLDETLYSSDEINFLYKKYAENQFSLKRSILIMCYYKYFQKIFNFKIWTGFFIILIYYFSPKVFVNVRAWWRDLQSFLKK